MALLRFIATAQPQDPLLLELHQVFRRSPLDKPQPKNKQTKPNAQPSAVSFRGPWFSAKTAAAYIPCKTVKAFYMWRRRHGIIPRANGSVAKADLDRALSLRRKPRRVMHPRSLANLRPTRAKRRS